MRPGRFDPRLVDALQVSHNGSGILGVIFLYGYALDSTDPNI